MEILAWSRLFNALQIRHKVLHGQVFREYQKMMIPLGPASESFVLNKKEIKEIKKLSSTGMVRLQQPSESLETGWWAIVCRQYKGVDAIRSDKARNQIRKAIASTSVKKVTADFILKNGMPVFLASEAARGKVSVKKTQEWIKQLQVYQEFPKLVHFWAVFAGEKMCAYCEVYVYDKEEANYSVIKFDPAFKANYPVYALIHTMTDFYLNQQKISMVNAGYRSLLHDTNFQDFLISKFGFEKYYLHMQLKLGLLMAIGIRLLSFNLFTNLLPAKLKALVKMTRISYR